MAQYNFLNRNNGSQQLEDFSKMPAIKVTIEELGKVNDAKSALDLGQLYEQNKSWIEANADEVYPVLQVKGQSVKNHLRSKALAMGWQPSLQRSPDLDFKGLTVNVSEGDFLVASDVNFPRLCALIAYHMLQTKNQVWFDSQKPTALAARIPDLGDLSGTSKYHYLDTTLKKIMMPGYAMLLRPMLLNGAFTEARRAQFILGAYALDWAAFCGKRSAASSDISLLDFIQDDQAARMEGVIQSLTRNVGDKVDLVKLTEFGKDIFTSLKAVKPKYVIKGKANMEGRVKSFIGASAVGLGY